MTIRPIETRYAGCRFRSRLEARWAVFFDALGIRWEYEPKGFETAAGPYLPDFRLPDHRLYVEIKGGHPTQRDFDRCTEIAKSAQRQRGDLIIFQGDIPNPDGDPFEEYNAWSFETPDDGDPFGEPEGWFYGSLPITFGDVTGDRYWACSSGIEDFLSALRAARSARFEHGESGAPARKEARS